MQIIADLDCSRYFCIFGGPAWMNLFWVGLIGQKFQPGLLGHPSLPLSILGSDVDLAEQRLGTSKAPWAEKVGPMVCEIWYDDD